MINNKYGNLTVVSFSHRLDGRDYWLCKCDCGNVLPRMEKRLKNGQNKSCGCKRYEESPSKRDLVGKTFTHLLVTSYHGRINTRPHWNCLCTCGNTALKSEKLLLNGETVSCGCRTGKQKIIKPTIQKRTKYEIFINGVYTRYKADANKRNFSFNLPKELFEILITKNCHYCGNVPSNGKSFKYSGIDRVNSDRGYEEDNVVPCCIICNKAKSDLPLEIFLTNMRRLWEHL